MSGVVVLRSFFVVVVAAGAMLVGCPDVGRGVIDAGPADDDDLPGTDAGIEGGADAGSEADVDAGHPVDDVAVCPTFAAGVSTGLLLDTAVQEASGLVAGRRNRGTLWVHNDSGASPVLFAITTSGRALGAFQLVGAEARDWEDIAVGPGAVPGEPALYVGDIGDNDLTRESVRIYRVAEPLIVGPPDPSDRVVDLAGVETFKLRYPDGPHNAETLVVDPTTGDVIIVVKASDGVSPVFIARAPLSSSSTATLEQVAILPLGEAPFSGDPRATGGDIAPDRSALVIRTPTNAFLWRWPAGGSVADALSGAPCPVPLRDEGQGEAIAFAVDGQGYFTVSEGPAPPIFFFASSPP